MDNQAMFDAGVRLDHLFWLPGISACPPSDFSEFIEELKDDEWPEFLEQFPFLKNCIEQDYPSDDLVCEFAMRDLNGFVFRAGTPVPKNIGKDGSFSFSWGHYTYKWLYAETMNDVIAKSVAFAEDVVAKAKAKAEVVA